MERRWYVFYVQEYEEKIHYGCEADLEYSWIARPVQLHKKSICQKLGVATKNPRPPLESSRKGASKWGGGIFVKIFFGD